MPQYTKIDYKEDQQRKNKTGNEPVDVFNFIDMRSNDPNACWRWFGAVGGRSTDPRPYFQARGRRTLAYRVVWELVHGVELTRDELVLHSCDNGTMPIGCCNPAHMRIGDHKDNNMDKALRSRGGLPAPAVRAIRRLLEKGDTHAEIAQLYGVSRTTITAIANNQTHIDVPTESAHDGGQIDSAN